MMVPEVAENRKKIMNTTVARRKRGKLLVVPPVWIQLFAVFLSGVVRTLTGATLSTS